MTKENKGLSIFAGIFLVIGLISSILITRYSTNVTKQKLVNEYREMFYTVERVEFKKTKDKNIKEIHELYNEKDFLLGTIYVGSGHAVGLEYYALGNNEAFDKNQKYEFEFEVLIRPNDRIRNMKVTYSEHTPEYVEKVEEYFENLLGELLVEYKLVDEVVGASDFTMPIVHDVLTSVVKVHLDTKPVTPPEAHELLFGEGTIAVDVEDFTGNDIVTSKQTIKDEEGNVLGYVYIAEATAKIGFYGDKDNLLKLMFAVDNDGKIVGFEVLETEHTPGFYDRYDEQLEALINKDVSDLQIDGIANVTGTFNVYKKIFNALKEVISNG